MNHQNSEELIKHGLNCVQNGQSKQAITSIEKAIKLEPDQPLTIYKKLGNLYLENNLLNKAQTIFEDLKENHPNHQIGYSGLAILFYLKKDWVSSQNLWKICFAKFTKHIKPNWYIKYAGTFFELKKYQEAADIYEKCKESFPNNIHGYIGKAKATSLNLQWEEAVKEWQLCIDLFPKQVHKDCIRHKKRALLKLGDFKTLEQENLKQLDPSSKSTYTKIQMDKFNKAKEPTLNFKHILIITYGRSGSTLLQGLLNAIDGVIIRGENNNIFWDFYKTFKKLINNKQTYFNSYLPNTPWYGTALYNESKLITGYQFLARKILVDDQFGDDKKFIMGFKEIRYNEIEGDFYDYLDFLQDIFPNTALIFNTRNLKDVANSAWWKDLKPEQVIKELSKLEDKFKHYSDNKKNCFHICYDDIISKNSNLKDMYSFLGAEYNQAIIDCILNTPHSYKPTQESTQKLFDNKNK